MQFFIQFSYSICFCLKSYRMTTSVEIWKLIKIWLCPIFNWFFWRAPIITSRWPYLYNDQIFIVILKSHVKSYHVTTLILSWLAWRKHIQWPNLNYVRTANFEVWSISYLLSNLKFMVKYGKLKNICFKVMDFKNMCISLEKQWKRVFRKICQ